MTEIYGLFDASGKLRYIGKANNSVKRLSRHMRDARRRRTPVYDWINKHGIPEMRVLHICAEGEDWRVVERRMIAEARERGERLLNLADGGDEPFCSAEVRRNLGYALAKRLEDNPILRKQRDMKRSLMQAIEDGYVSNRQRKLLRDRARLGNSFLNCFANIPDRPEGPDGQCLWQVGKSPSGRYGYVQNDLEAQ